MNNHKAYNFIMSFKRGQSRILMFLIMSVMGIGSMWAQAPSVWNGTPANSIARGSGTKNDPYIISSAAEFVYFGSKLNNNTQYWKLGVNIDLNNMEWTYGENSANTFKGHFDGDGHTVSKYKIAPTSGKNNGLFCAMEGVSATERADVKNLTINNVSITHTDKLANTTNTGALVGNVGKYVDFADVHANNVTITFADLTNTNYVGALVGQLQKNSSITNCSIEKSSINVTGTISGGASYIGGAIGRVTGANTSEVSTINGLTVTSPTVTVNKNSVNNSYIGTVFGQINNYSTFTKINVSNPSLTYKATDNPNNSLYLGTFAGGIFGNAAMETALTDVKISGNVQMTIGTGSSDISNIRAGLIGQSTTNTRMENWTIAATIVKVNGNLTVSSSNIGGLAGYIASAANAPMTLRNIKITGNSSISVSGNVAVGSQLGGIIGNASTSDATNNQTYISDVEIVGKASIAVGGNISGGSNMGGLAGYFAGRSKDNCLMEIKKVTIATSDISVGGQVSAGSCFGGLTGKVTTGCIFNECGITTAANLTFSDNIASTSYIGGAIGDFAGANGYNSYINTLTVKSSTISVKGYSEKGSLTGGVIGRVSTFTGVDDVTLAGVVITSKGDVLASQQIGIFAGAITGNATQQIPVKNITIDNSKVTLGTSGSNNIVGLKAGIIGQVNSNVLLDSWKATNCNVIKVNGNLITTGSQIGGFVGNMTSGANAPIIVNKIILEGNSGVNVSGNVTAGSQLSGIIGNASTSDAVNNKTTISDVEIIGKASVAVGGNISSGSYMGGFAGAVTGRAKTDCLTEITKITIPTSDISVGGQISAGSYFGGLIGRAVTACTLNDCKITTAANLIFSNDIAAVSYIGGAIGDFAGANGYTSYIKELTVKFPTISVKNYSAGTSLTGGVFGRVSTFTEVDGVTLTGASMTFTNDLSVAQQIGTFAGIINGNATQQISVKNITIDNSELTFGTSAASSTIGIKAGIIGQVNSNVLLDSWKITGSSNIKINGNLITKNNFIGGLVGYMASEANAPMRLTNIKIAGNSTVSVSGDVTVGSYLSGLIGYSGTTSDVAYNKTTISDVEIAGKTSVIVSGNLSGVSYIGGFAGYVVGRAKADCLTEIKNITLAASSISVGDLSTANNYIGALVGRANTSCSISNWKIQSQANITIGGNVTATCHVGGAFGSLEGTANYPLTASDIEVKGLDIVLNGNLKNTLYVGGITGQLTAIATTPNKIEKCSVIGKIHTVGTHTFNESMLYAFGGIVGYTAQSATNISEVSQCISSVDFNLSGLTPVTKTNLYRNGFVVGGIIGRMNTPSRLPEHLYYTGKIYAPYAAVAPIVGVFCTNMNNAAYLYNDYSGENAAYISAEEWQKTNTWYFTDYKLGLSPEVMTQNARTRNYSATPTVEDGINYLLVDDKTFAEYNKIGSAIKKSFTVLAYTQDNKDVDHGIYPQWNKNQSDYPTYYMYYMQGLNRGVFTPKDESDFARLLMDKKLNFMPQMIHSGDAGHGYEFIVDAGRLEDDGDFTITYQWYRSDKTTPLQGENSKILSIGKTDLDAVGGTIYCVVTISGSDCRAQRTLMGTVATVVFVDGTNGIDNEKGKRDRGWSPNTAVKTIDNANQLLDGGSWDNNIIVIMGVLDNDYKFQSSGHNPATLTGKWNGIDYGGVIRLSQVDPVGGEHSVNPIETTPKSGSNCYILGDTKFENLTFYGNKTGNTFIELHGYDAFFGKGLVMKNFNNLSLEHGNMNNSEIIPEFTIILYATNLSEEVIKNYTKRIHDRGKPQTVTFQSGHYGRLMAGRFTQKFFYGNKENQTNWVKNTAYSILGSAEYPVWAEINVEIDADNEMTDDYNGKGTIRYSRDVNAIIAGLTDGSMYGDYTINFYGGNVAYIVGANQGNPVNNGDKSYIPLGGKDGKWGQWPNASFFGRSVINIDQKDGIKGITVGNLYAGGLGRKVQTGSATAVVDMYVYGHTEVNVKNGVISGSVYGGGVGGVLGVNPWDAHVPYQTAAANAVDNAIQNGVQYGDTRYGSWSSMNTTSDMAKVRLHNLNDTGDGYVVDYLNLKNTSTTVNITGGTVNGNVYGGGYGFVQDMPKDATMQGVGSVFGTANININGGTINGNIYGGSRGHSEYYNKNNTYNQLITHIAEMNGTVNLTISGTETQYPTISGTIYGGGQGLESKDKDKQKYTRIATTGNTELGDAYKTNINITIDMPEDIEFHNDIYGGGALGMVDGTTNIVLKRGKFTGNIYGGGYGEKNYPDKAMVNGDITISTGDANPANIDRGLPVVVNNTIYGGGNMAQVIGNTFVNIHHGNITGDVFGGGKGLTSSESGTETNYGKVTGNTHVLYNNATENNILTGNIYGGGALGDVKGNTEVKIKDGIIKGNVFGAGKGEEGHPDKAKVSGNTNVIVEDKK